MEKREYFSSRWTLLLSTLGMAIGAGNIWRFPRLAGQYGGAFLLPWALFLVLWSIPLIMVEFAIGKSTRKGTIGAFTQFLGPRFAWMGGFVALCTMAIMFYYSVVTGWALKYFLASLSGSLLHNSPKQYWENFISTHYQPVVFHLLALSLASWVIYRGITRGIERANRILLPALFVLLVIGVIRSLTLPGASVGLDYLFGLRLEALKDYRVWLEGLSQSAWSTGAGWGLVLTYAVYMRDREDTTLNAFITGFGNNSASLLAGLAIIPSVFALSPDVAQALGALKEGNQGLSFIAIPRLFATLYGASFFLSIFFLGLFFAALSSLISMLELATRLLMDFGWSRKKALPTITFLTAVLGTPSALSMKIFNNQDWVWGLGLILSGAFFAYAVIRHGVEKFRQQYLTHRSNDLPVGRWFNRVVQWLIPLEAIALITWWFSQSIHWEGSHWWHPFRPFSIGTCLFQWILIIGLLIFLNKKLVNWLKQESAK